MLPEGGRELLKRVEKNYFKSSSTPVGIRQRKEREEGGGVCVCVGGGEKSEGKEENR